MPRYLLPTLVCALLCTLSARAQLRLTHPNGDESIIRVWPPGATATGSDQSDGPFFINPSSSGVRVSKSGGAISIHPNPASGDAVPSLVLDRAGDARISVIDMLGRQVLPSIERRVKGEG
jgi:hypothetical protein